MRLQTSYVGAKDSARNTLRGILSSEGLTGLYRGMSLPLMGTVLETAMLFTANGYLKRRLREEQGLHPDAELPMPYVLLAGAGTGFCVAWVLTPIELVKCRMQVSGQPMQPMEGGGSAGSGGGSASGRASSSCATTASGGTATASTGTGTATTTAGTAPPPPWAAWAARTPASCT